MFFYFKYYSYSRICAYSCQISMGVWGGGVQQNTLDPSGMLLVYSTRIYVVKFPVFVIDMFDITGL